MGLAKDHYRCVRVLGPGTVRSGEVVDLESGMPSDERAEPNEPGAGGPRVLVAEDSLVNRRLAAQVLSGLGCRVELVADGHAAVEAWSRAEYDLVLMDCEMPGMDGYRATEVIRASEGSGRHTCIIAMTAHASRDNRERCLAAGMDDHLVKPLRAETLAATLRCWLGVRLTPAAGTAGPLDGELIGQLLALDRGQPGFLAHLIGLFRAELAEHLPRLIGAVAGEDWETARLAAHRLRGAGGNLAATELVALLEQCEEAAEQGDGELLRERVPALSEAAERAERALQGLLPPVDGVEDR